MDKKVLALVLAAITFSSAAGGVYAGSFMSRGSPGTNGTNGANGIDGANGTNGVNGIDGKNGTNGTTTLVYRNDTLIGTKITQRSNSSSFNGPEYPELLSVNASSPSTITVSVLAITPSSNWGFLANVTVALGNSTAFFTDPSGVPSFGLPSLDCCPSYGIDEDFQATNPEIAMGFYPVLVTINFSTAAVQFQADQYYSIILAGRSTYGNFWSVYSFDL